MGLTGYHKHTLIRLIYWINMHPCKYVSKIVNFDFTLSFSILRLPLHTVRQAVTFYNPVLCSIFHQEQHNSMFYQTASLLGLKFITKEFSSQWIHQTRSQSQHQSVHQILHSLHHQSVTLLLLADDSSDLTRCFSVIVVAQ